MRMRCTGIVIIALAAAALGGCANSALTESGAKEFFADPQKYTLYNCSQLALARPPIVERERQLRVAIAKAERDSAGVAISNAAYRSDYLAVRGELDVLDSTAERKGCAPAAASGPRQSTTITR